PGNACCGSSANALAQLRSCVGCTFRSCDACAYDTPRSLTSFTASSLNSRVNFRLSMTHLLLHKTPNLVSSEPGAAQLAKQQREIAHLQERLTAAENDGSLFDPHNRHRGSDLQVDVAHPGQDLARSPVKLAEE